MRLSLASFSMLAVLSSVGCGFHAGLQRDANTFHDFQFKMDVSEVQYSRTASGSANIGLVFCSIPLSDDPYRQAMEELSRNASLKKNEILANFRDDLGFTSFLGFYCNSRLTVSADVITVTPRGAAPATPPPG